MHFTFDVSVNVKESVFQVQNLPMEHPYESLHKSLQAHRLKHALLVNKGLS